MPHSKPHNEDIEIRQRFAVHTERFLYMSPKYFHRNRCLWQLSDILFSNFLHFHFRVHQVSNDIIHILTVFVLV
jgi:hypothetical protein